MAKLRRKHGNSYEAGLAHARAGRHLEAITCFENELALRPDDAHILFALANTANAVGHTEAAENFFRRVLAQEPDRVEALVNFANLLRARGRTAETIALLKPAIERNRHHAELWMTLGSALRESGDRKTAEIFYREALRLSPGSAPALGNLADLLGDRGAVDEALLLYNRALKAEPGNAQARLNRAFLRFLKGDLKDGWRDYEYRLAIKSRTISTDHGLRRWNGKMGQGVKLLVTAEQGIGDQIMFASVIPELAEKVSRSGGHLILEAEPRLVPLFARSFSGASVHASNIEQVGGNKYARYGWLSETGGARAAIEIASLPFYLRRDLADFPSPHVYLKPDPGTKEHWRNWMRGHGGAPYIGVCWRSGQMGGLRNLQYAPLESWAELLRSVEGTIVSLQYDADPQEIARLADMSGREILLPQGLDQKNEIDATAAMIASLDRVVSAPTSVACIAAGLGVPTLKLLYNTSWTSFGKDYEPFAPACRPIMPRVCGDWSDTFAKATVALSSPLP